MNQVNRLSKISALFKGIWIFAMVLILVQCSEEEEPMVIVEPEVNPVNLSIDDPFDLLSEYNFFEGTLSQQNPNEIGGVIPYDLNTALFSDYAFKKRFVYVPEGSQIPFNASSEVLNLPVGSVLIKTFYYKNNDGSDKLIETRLLIHSSSGWDAQTYIWNDAQTDAIRSVIGATKSLTVMANGTEQTFSYLIPNQNQCKNCHAFNGTLVPIGPTVPNLNKDYSYTDGRDNQIVKWVQNGILSDPSTSILPAWGDIDAAQIDLNDRARAYLHVNCASCHRREGSAANSGLYLEYDNMDSLSLGFWKTPVAAGDGSGGLSYGIYPGNAQESILLYRMKADAVDERMPEIGRELLHVQGIELIREWIDSM